MEIVGGASSEVSQLVMEKYFAFKARCVSSVEFAVEFAENYIMHYCIMAFPHQLPPIILGKLGTSKINHMAPIISGKKIEATMHNCLDFQTRNCVSERVRANCIIFFFNFQTTLSLQ